MVRDFSRAMQWLTRVNEAVRALAVPQMASFCRNHFVAFLTWRGEFARAEHEISAMRQELADIAPAFLPHADVRLGEIRRR